MMTFFKLEMNRQKSNLESRKKLEMLIGKCSTLTFCVSQQKNL